MINSIIQWSILNRILVLLITFIISIIGIYALKHTPVDAIPDLSDVQVIIKTNYPGQAPEVVEDQVTYPISTAMLAVPGAKAVRGFSYFGDSFVYVIFDDKTDIYWARSRVLEYLSQMAPRLPAEAQPQLGPDATGVGWIYMYALVDRTGQHDLSELRSLQDWFLRFELQPLEGVSEVATVGGMVRQYQIHIDPQKLRAYDLPLSHIQTAIDRSNSEVGASVIELAEAEYMIRATGYIQSIDDLENIPLGKNLRGAPLKLKDIATIEIGPQMRRGVSDLNGEGEAVGAVIVMRYGENAKATIDRVKEKITKIKASLPEGVEIIPVYDRSNLIVNSIKNLWQKLAQELLMMALVCAVFLFHIRSALVAIIALPIGILISILIMYFQGLNANIMSLGGIAIAIGAMIDGAIVLIENTHRHQEKSPHLPRWEIVSNATKEVGPSIFFSLLIITVSFAPIFFLEAQEHRMFAPLAYTKTYAMAAAALLSVTLVPVLIGLFIYKSSNSSFHNPINHFLEKLYTPALEFILNNPKSVLLVATLVALTGIVPVAKTGSEFMPELDEGDLMYMPTTYPAISIGKARELLQQTNRLITSVPEVKTVFGKAGRAETATDPAPLTMIETFIQLQPKDQWRQGITIEKLKNELNEKVTLPGLSNAWVMPIKTRIDMLATGIKTPLGIKISGNNLNEIEDIGQQIEGLLSNLPETASVYAERVASGRYVNIAIKREKAAQYGLTVKDIQEVIATAVGGRNIAYSVEKLERYPIHMRYLQDYRDSPEALLALTIVTEHGQQLSLGDVANIDIEEGPAGIKSENARLNGWIYIDIQNSNIDEYVEKTQGLIDSNIHLPPGYSLKWAGQFEYIQRVQQKLTIIIPITLLIIATLLFINFQRAREIFLVILTLPFSLVGGLWLMYWLGYNFSVSVAVGFIALAGVATETTVIMLHYLKQSVESIPQENLNQKALRQATINGARKRLRPVIMTSIATIAGLIPIMLGTGTGSEVMRPIAVPMVGGMVTAVLLTLCVVPVAYFLVQKRFTH